MNSKLILATMILAFILSIIGLVSHADSPKMGYQTARKICKDRGKKGRELRKCIKKLRFGSS